MTCALILFLAVQNPIRDGKAMAAEVVGTGWLTLDEVRFADGTAALPPASEAVLEPLATMLKEHDEWRFEVQAHAEAGVGRAARLALADARARAVVTWLTAHGIAATRLVPRGYAEPAAERRPRLLLRRIHEE